MPNSRLLIYWCSVLFLVALPIQINAGDGRWTGHGPFMTNLYFLEISPSNPAVLYAGNSYALLRSTDSGFTWTQLTSAPSSYCSVVSTSCVSLFKPHPQNDQIAYA